MSLPLLLAPGAVGQGTTMLGSVRVYLCRHAKAAPGEPDDLRELTGKGRKQARALGEQLARAPEPPVLVLTSPLTRARQTAEAIAEATGAPLRVEPRLAPGATARDVRAAVAGTAGSVAMVGHQPDCSEIAFAVTGADLGFAPGSMVELELDP